MNGNAYHLCGRMAVKHTIDVITVNEPDADHRHASVIAYISRSAILFKLYTRRSRYSRALMKLMKKMNDSRIAFGKSLKPFTRGLWLLMHS